MRGRMAPATVGADIPDPEFLLAEQEVDDRRLADDDPSSATVRLPAK